MRKKKSYNKSHKEVFKDYIGNEEEYIKAKDLYIYIKEEYLDRMKNDKISIEIEKARLDREINQCKINSLPNYMSFLLLSITVLATGFITAYTQYTGKLNKYTFIVGFTVFLVILILSTGFSTSKEFILDDKKVIVFKLCFKVLDDIEKEIAEEQIKTKEDADRFERYQRIEQLIISKKGLINYITPAFNEIASGLVSKVFKKYK